MTHSPPIPPGNQPPYPTIEPPHAHPDPAPPRDETAMRDRAGDLAPKLIAGAVVVGATRS